MSALALVVALVVATPCEKAHGVEQGTPSPCTGVLVPTDEAKQCLTSMRVLLPTCEADLELVGGTLSAAKDAFSVQLEAKEEQVATEEPFMCVETLTSGNLVWCMPYTVSMRLCQGRVPIR